MIDMKINVGNFVRGFSKQLNDLQYRQLPFIQSTAINAVAQKIKDKELQGFRQTFKTPTPFTMNAIGIQKARKDNPTAIIFVKDIQSKYLNPYEFGGKQVPHKEAMITPKNINLNQYGNIPFGALKLLKAQTGLANAIKLASKLDMKSGAASIASAQAQLDTLRKGAGGYFIGKVMTKNGLVGGLWQRPMSPTTASGRKRKLTPQQGQLKLIVRFTDPQTVKQHLDYMLRARIVVGSNMVKELQAAMTQAMATRKP